MGVDDDTHGNAAKIDRAYHVGRALAQWRRQRIEASRPDGTQNLIRRHETAQEQ
jgi:hypothetical protein